MMNHAIFVAFGLLVAAQLWPDHGFVTARICDAIAKIFHWLAELQANHACRMRSAYRAYRDHQYKPGSRGPFVVTRDPVDLDAGKEFQTQSVSRKEVAVM